MAFSSWYIHTCNFQTNSGTAVTGAGEPVPVWGTTYADVPCRYVQKVERYADKQRGERMVREDRIFIDHGYTITTAMRVTDIRLVETGATVAAGPLTITEVLGRNARSQRHITIKVDRVA